MSGQRTSSIVLGGALTALAAERSGSLILPHHSWIPALAALAGFFLVSLRVIPARLQPFATILLAALAGLAGAHVLNSNLVTIPNDPIRETQILVAPVAVVLGAALAQLLFEGRAWTVIVLAGLLLILSADINATDTNRFPLYLLLSVLVVLATVTQERPGSPTVSATRVRDNPDSQKRWIAPLAALAVTIGGTAGVITLAWHVPSAPTAWSANFSDPLRAALTGGAPDGSVLLLQGPFRPSGDVVMTIRSTYHGPLRLTTGTFDRYTGSSWVSDSTISTRVSSGQIVPAAQGARPVTLLVQAHDPTSLLAFPGAAARVSVPSFASSLTRGTEASAVRSVTTLPTGAVYLSEGFLQDRTRLYGGLETEYLQLGSENNNVARLARRFRRGTFAATALAIQSYLHSSRFHYDQAAGSPLVGDAVSSFLFDTHRGYCNQFASAMTILLREDGIPARLVTGYLTDMVSPGHYTVRDSDAHSWVQAYLPQSGWTTFDPTPGRASVARESTSRVAKRSPEPLPQQITSIMRRGGATTHKPHPALPADRTRTPAAAPSDTREVAPRWTVAAIPCGLLVLLAILMYLVRRRRSIEQIYSQIARGRNRDATRIRPHETPLEFASRLDGPHAADLRSIVRMYVAARFARRQPTGDEMRQAREAWVRATSWNQRLLS